MFREIESHLQNDRPVLCFRTAINLILRVLPYLICGRYFEGGFSLHRHDRGSPLELTRKCCRQGNVLVC